MKNQCFANLHLHGIHSIQDSLISPVDIAIKAKEYGFKYLAQTDHGNCSGSIKFQKECLKNDIIPIIGEELYVTENINKKEKGEKRAHILVLCKNEIGWKNLLQMNTIANLDGFYWRPRIDPSVLLSHSEGLIFSTACVSSFIHTNWGMELLNQLVKKHPEDTYLEIMPHKHPLQLETNEKCLRLRDKYHSLRLVATVDSHFINKEDKKSHEVLLAIKSKKVMSDPTRWKFTEGFDCYFPTADEMIQMFQNQDQLDRETYITAMKETIKVAKKCENFRINPKPISLPKVPRFKNRNSDEVLENLCIGDFGDIYSNRIKEELKIIISKGFSSYFLIVYDLVQWCQVNDIMVGPGRGSVGGSLVAFTLGITNVDPIKYDLPFSRFINEERIDFPDIDLDFEDSKRERVIQYLKDTYGEDNVAGISTFLVLKSRSAIRDVCRTFEIPLDEADELAKSVPFDSNLKSEIDGENEVVEKYLKKYPEVINHTLKIEKTLRATSRHAAGTIVADENLRDGYRCNLDNREGHIVVNWEKDDAEKQGLMKLDILGLSTLSVLAECKELIKQNHNRDIDFDQDVDLEDKNVLKMISDGNTAGIFQAGTVPMTMLIKEMGIEKFSHFVDAVALVRPGARDSGETEKYIKRKHGEKWEPKHPIYEEVTKDTYGVLVTQEQTMNVIHKVAGLPYPVADNIRKIIGKKRDASEFEKYKQMFIDGCKKQKTLTIGEAEAFWIGLQYAASYLFNSSHSLAYAMLGMWTAYCKYYYAAEFIASSLTFGTEAHKPDLIREARRLGLKIFPPKVGISDALKWKTKDNNLYCPMNEIKGIGEKTLEKLASTKTGFYSPDQNLLKGKVKKILEEIDAFNPDSHLPIEACHYFDIELCSDYPKMYPKLCKLYGINFSEIPIEKALTGKLRGFEFVKEIDKYEIPKEMKDCKDCELRKQCWKVVLPSIGKTNCMIIAEAPGKQEDKEGSGLVGPAGEVLWKELKKHKLKRKMFHVTNCCKCFPNILKTPKKEHIDVCRKWLEKEIEIVKPKIVLVTGNISKSFFDGEITGIMKLNGTTLWNENYGTYVCYCIHPSAVLRDPSKRPDFEIGIKNFSDILTELGGI